MAKITMEEAQKYSGGGGAGKYFKVEPNETALVRFLWDSLADIEAYTVHEIRVVENGTQRFFTVDCGGADCKYCKSKNPAVARVIIPVWNVDTNQIQYWKRSASWIDTDLKPVLEESPSKNIVGQVYKIKRTGEGKQTKYPIFIVGQPDEKSAKEFGELEDPFTLKMIKEANSDIAVQETAAEAATQPQPTRTSEVF